MAILYYRIILTIFLHLVKNSMINELDRNWKCIISRKTQKSVQMLLVSPQFAATIVLEKPKPRKCHQRRLGCRVWRFARIAVLVHGLGHSGPHVLFLVFGSTEPAGPAGPHGTWHPVPNGSPGPVCRGHVFHFEVCVCFFNYVINLDLQIRNMSKLFLKWLSF